MIMSSHGNKVLSNALHHAEQDKNSSKVAEAITLLELVKVITKKSKNTRSRKMIIALDRREVNRMIANKVCKATTLACDRGGEIAAIRDAIKTFSI